MHLFTDGIKLTETKYACILHITANPEQWLRDVITEKARLRRDALINEWQSRLFADPAVTELPADAHELCALIMARDDYRTRLQQDSEIGESPYLHNIKRYEAIDRSGPTVTLFADGIDQSDADCACILAYVQDLDDWVLGALLGKINQGKKTLIKEWYPKLLDDPEVSTMPATEDGLITMILARDDYKRNN